MANLARRSLWVVVVRNVPVLVLAQRPSRDARIPPNLKAAHFNLPWNSCGAIHRHSARNAPD